jgi:5-methyltetrahydrofolate--homocysteine methyltransferase
LQKRIKVLDQLQVIPCPDHLEKPTIKLLNVEEEIGVTLTESMAMWPTSSVSGYYFGNPESKYFGLGKIKEDQVIDYAKRRSVSTEVAMKWLNKHSRLGTLGN